MDLTIASQENLKILLNELADRLNVVNRGLLDADDYDINKYDDLKFLYDVIMQKDKISTFEAQAFVEELGSIRKK